MSCAVVALLLVAPDPPAPAGVPPALWKHLLGWERVMTWATGFVAEGGTKTDFDARTSATRTFAVSGWHLKPNRLRLRLDRVPPPGQKPDPNAYTTYVGDGRAVWEYDGATKTVTRWPVWLTGRFEDNLLLAVVGGSVTARQVAERFAVGWVKPDDPTYLVLELTPLRPGDRNEFDRLTLVLVKPGLQPPHDRLAYLPRLAKIAKPNGLGTETWDLPNFQADPVNRAGQPITAADFEPFDPGEGWRVPESLRAGAAGR